MTTDLESTIEILRIKKRINSLSNGVVFSLINYAVSSLVTLEISNGTEKITIQQIMLEIKNRFKKLNEYLDELLIDNDVLSFKKKVYKLFNLVDLIQILIKKCVSFNFAINKIINIFSKAIDDASNKLVDDIFFLHSDKEYMDYIELLIDERLDIFKKDELMGEKINFLSGILSQYVGIEIEMNIMHKNK